MAKDNAKEPSAAERAAEARNAAVHRQQMGQRVADLLMLEVAKPIGFVRAAGHQLYDDNYRVNLLTESWSEFGLVPSQSIAASYFVVSNGLEIVRATPTLSGVRT